MTFDISSFEGLVIPVPDTPEWTELVAASTAADSPDTTELVVLMAGASTLEASSSTPQPIIQSDEVPGTSDVPSLPLSPTPVSDPAPRKRRRGISPPQRVQRPRVSLEEGVEALHALDQDQQQMVEEEASRGISGPNAIHRYLIANFSLSACQNQ